MNLLRSSLSEADVVAIRSFLGKYQQEARAGAADGDVDFDDGAEEELDDMEERAPVGSFKYKDQLVSRVGDFISGDATTNGTDVATNCQPAAGAAGD